MKSHIYKHPAQYLAHGRCSINQSPHTLSFLNEYISLCMKNLAERGFQLNIKTAVIADRARGGSQAFESSWSTESLLSLENRNAVKELGRRTRQTSPTLQET